MLWSTVAWHSHKEAHAKRTRGKCRKPQASALFISRVFSNVRSVLSQCNTQFRLFICFMIEILHTLSRNNEAHTDKQTDAI